MSAPLQSVGIDLGTTNSEIYTFKDNHAEVVPGPNGLTITPSRVVVDNVSTSENLVFAQRNRKRNVLRLFPQNEIYEPKRVIGRKINDEYIRVDRHYWPFEIKEGENGQPLYSVTGKDNQEIKLSAVDVDAEILRTLKEYAKGGVTNAVITIPSYFNEDQIRETTEAGKKAGLNVLECLHEPVAAAIAYGYANSIQNATVLVYDLGGGTFDCCIVRIVGGKYHILASDGHSHLGGADFDNAIVKMVADYLREHDIDIYSHKKELRSLKELAENAKKFLSGSSSYDLQFSCENKVKNEVVTYKREFMRADFEQLISRYVNVTIGYIQRCLDQLGLTTDNIDYVIPVGGSTRIPCVMKALNDYFHREIDTTRVNIDEAVAAGAAIQANALVNGNSLVIPQGPKKGEEAVVNPDDDVMDPMPAIPLTVYYSVGKGYMALFNKGHVFKASKSGEKKVRSNRNVNPPIDFVNSVPFEFFSGDDEGHFKYLGGTKFMINTPKKAEEVRISLQAVITCRGRLSVVISNREENFATDVVLRVRDDMLDNEEIENANKLRQLTKDCKQYLLALVKEPNLPATVEKRERLMTLIQDLDNGGEYMDMVDILERSAQLAELKSQLSVSCTLPIFALCTLACIMHARLHQAHFLFPLMKRSAALFASVLLILLLLLGGGNTIRKSQHSRWVRPHSLLPIVFDEPQQLVTSEIPPGASDPKVPVLSMSHVPLASSARPTPSPKSLQQNNASVSHGHLQSSSLPPQSPVAEPRAPLWKQSHFYMQLGLAYPDVDKKVQDASALAIPERVVGRRYPRYTAALDDEEEWFATPYRADEDWPSRFSLLQEMILSNYRNVTRTKYDKPWDSSYSQFRVEYAIDSDSGWIRSKNLCYERKKATFHVYSLDGHPVNIRSYGKQFFRFGWHFEFHRGRPPVEDALWLNTTHNYIGVAFHARHITHFAESVNLLLLKLLAPAEFPQLQHLFLPTFRDFSEYEWSKQYLRLLVDSFPAELAPRVWKRQDIILLQRRFNTPRYLCFRSAVLMDRMAYNKDGGIFAGFFSADWMRALSYKHAQALRTAPAQPTPHLSVVERLATRRWRQLPRYLAAIERRFAGRLNTTRMPLSGKSYADQVRLFYETDILLGGHGSAMANVFFMRPGTALIECNPPYFFEMCFANIAFISRLHYISVTNYNHSYVPKYLHKEEVLYERGTFFLYRRKYADFDIYPNVLSVVAAVEDAYEFVRRKRHVYAQNDRWSRVFY